MNLIKIHGTLLNVAVSLRLVYENNDVYCNEQQFVTMIDFRSKKKK